MVSLGGRGRRLLSEAEGKNGVTPTALQSPLLPCFFALAWDTSKETYGRSLRRPTVGRHHDLQWFFSTTYRGSFFSPLKASGYKGRRGEVGSDFGGGEWRSLKEERK